MNKPGTYHLDAIEQWAREQRDEAFRRLSTKLATARMSGCCGWPVIEGTEMYEGGLLVAGKCSGCKDNCAFVEAE